MMKNMRVNLVKTMININNLLIVFAILLKYSNFAAKFN